MKAPPSGGAFISGGEKVRRGPRVGLTHALNNHESRVDFLIWLGVGQESCFTQYALRGMLLDRLLQYLEGHFAACRSQSLKFEPGGLFFHHRPADPFHARS